MRLSGFNLYVEDYPEQGQVLVHNTFAGSYVVLDAATVEVLRRADRGEPLAPDEHEFRAFDLSDAVIDRNRRRALSILDAILRDGMVGADATRLMFPAAIGGIVLGALRAKLASLLRAREMLDAGRPSAEVLAELRVPPFLRDAALRQARLRSAEELKRALRELIRYDLELKGAGAFPEATLTRMIVALT